MDSQKVGKSACKNEGVLSSTDLPNDSECTLGGDESFDALQPEANLKIICERIN